MLHQISARCLALALVVSLTCGSCGWASAVVVSASGNGAGDTPSQLLASQLAVRSTRLSPATIAFTLTDPDATGIGRPVRIALSLENAQFGAVPIGEQWLFSDATLTTNAVLSNLVTSSQGTDHVVFWDFAAQFAGDPALAGAQALVQGFHTGFTVRSSIEGSSDVDTAAFSLANDPPAVTNPIVVNADPLNGVTGLVAVSLGVSDSGADPVSVTAEFAVAPEGGGLPTSWSPASSQGAPLANLATNSDGSPTSVQFFWDAVQDLGNLRSGAFLRFTPDDGAAEDGVPLTPGVPVPTTSFLIDNNSNPIVSVDQVSFQLNSDHQRGIPIRFQVADLDGDPVRVLFQYRRSFESVFVPLPPLSGPALIEAAKDPEFRRQFQIATDFDPESVGSLVAANLASAAVRLPELVDSRSTLPQRNCAGRTLQILRSSTRVTRVDTDWAVGAAQLVQPVACLSAGEGISALVLDATAPQFWSLRRVDLATGSVLGTVVLGASGAPAALAEVPGDDTHVLVLTRTDPVWRVESIALATGVITTLASSTATGAPGFARGIAAIGGDRAVMTLDDKVVLLTLSPTTPSAVTVAAGLATPIGIVRDPTQSGACLVAEQGFVSTTPVGVGAIKRIDVGTGRVERLAFLDQSSPSAAYPTPRPRGLAIDPRSGHLIAFCDALTNDSTGEIREFDIAGGTSRILSALVPDNAEQVAAGQAGLRLVPLPTTPGIDAIGGVEQERRIVAFDGGSGLATVLGDDGDGTAFAPPLTPARCSARHWRVRGLNPALPASDSARSEVFVWDTHDVRPAATVAVRAIPIDTEIGASANSGGSILIRDPFDNAPRTIGTANTRAVGAADVNRDGREDLIEIVDVISSFGESLGGEVRVRLQLADGSYDDTGTPSFTIGDTSTLRAPQALRIADLNSDGVPDLVIANGNPAIGGVSGNFVSIYLSQAGTLSTHGAAPDIVLGRTTNTFDPADLELADLNGDGRLDVITANRAGNDVSVFLQTSALVFGDGASPAAPSFKLGGVASTSFPLAVAAGDLDGNGKVDIAVAVAGSARVAVFRQNTGLPMTFSAPLLLTTGSSPLDVEIGDIDGDGGPDLVVADQGTAPDEGRVTIFLQQNGVLSAPFFRAPSCSEATDLALAVSIGDLDRDGLTEVVLRRRDGISIFYQAVDEDDPAPIAFRELCLSTVAAFAGSVARHEPLLRDLDGDGDHDVLVGSSAGVIVFDARGGGDFADTPDFVTNQALTLGVPPLVAAGDLDGDGDSDLLVASTMPPGLHGFVQTVPGVLSSSIVLPLAAVSGSPSQMLLVDLDGERDGDHLQDIVLAEPVAGDVRILLQVAPGVFGVPLLGSTDTLALTVPGAATTQISLAAADLLDGVGPDDDGLVDLVVGSNGADRIFVFRQTAPLVFESSPSVALGAAGGLGGPLQLAAVELVDLAGAADDGLLDIAVTADGQDAVLIYAQRTPGLFGTPGGLPTTVLASGTSGSGPLDLVCIDLDHDGRADVLAATPGVDGVEVWFQLSSGSFGGAGSIPSLTLDCGAAVSAVEVSDIDADGDLDVLATAGNEAGFAAFRQTTPGRFRAAKFPRAPLLDVGGTGPQSLVVLDFDGDGDSDVVHARSGTNELRLWFGGR